MNSYSGLQTFEKDGISFSHESVMPNGDAIQFRSAKKGAGTLYNTTSLGKIASVVVTISSKANASYYGALSLYVSATPLTSIEGGTKVESTNDGTTWTYNVTGDYGYLYLIDETDYSSQNASIVINYAIA